MDKKISIAIDGPAAAGKSTVAKLVAETLSYIYIDTGAMYRALTYKALSQEINFEYESELHKLLSETEIELVAENKRQIVYLDGSDVTDEIRSAQVTNSVSIVSRHPSVREEMVKRQQLLASGGGVVMDGRDIGTHVLPDAELKVFLIASVEERANRRHEENLQKGYQSNLKQLHTEIEQRDKLDSEREVAPLKQAEDAILIDTTSLAINQVAERILELARERIWRK